MESPDRRRRNQLEQLQSDARALERTLAELEAEIARATSEVEAAEGECRAVEMGLARVRAAPRAEARAKVRSAARVPWDVVHHAVVENDPGPWLVALGMSAIVGGVAPWEFFGLTSAHVFAAGAAVVFLGFFLSWGFHGPSDEALYNAL